MARPYGLVSFRRIFALLVLLVVLPSAGLSGFGVVAIVNERAAVEQRLERAWQGRLGGGLVIELGRDAPNDSVDGRLERFVAVHPQTLARMQRKHQLVDLRYPNGFALRVPELKGG